METSEAVAMGRGPRRMRMAADLLWLAFASFIAGLVAAIVGVLVVMLLATPAYASRPMPRLVVPHAELPIVLRKLEVKAEVTGALARTTVQMTFHNPNRRQLEGELQFPLLDRQQVTGFALDIDGKLRDAVVVAKSRGQQVFEDITRQRIDPGLLEATQGNNFKLRVYPIFPDASRTVAITYTETLGTRGGQPVYRLPLEYGARLPEFSISVRIHGAGPGTRVLSGPFREISLAASGSVRELALERRGFDAKGVLEIAIDGARGARVVTQQLDGERYFYAQVPIVARKVKRKAPGTIGIVWDSSQSGLGRNHVRELALLDRYFTAVQNAEVRLVRIRDQAENPASFRVENGDWSELRRTLERTIYDGATNLGAFVPDPAVKEYLLFSDGLGNYGDKGLAPPAVPLHAIASGTQANPAWLRHIAHATGGRYFDLSTEAPHVAAESLLFDVERVKSVTSNRARALAAASPYAEDGVLAVSGILNEPDAEIRVELALADRRSRVLTFRVREREGEGSFAAALWARERIAALEGDYDANRGEVLRLGRKFALVTRETSLIVLETIHDYVRFEIEPPRELLAEYERLRGTTYRARTPDVRQRIERVVAMLDEREAWWKRDFPKSDLRVARPIPHAAATWTERKDAYLTDSNGAPVRSAGAGVCVRNGQWSPALAIAQCEPDLVPKPAPKPAPAPKPEAKPMMKPAKPQMASPTSVHVAGGEIKGRAWNPDAPYRARLRQAGAEDAYRVYLDERPNYAAVPAFYIDASEMLMAKGLRELALRVLSNLAEIDLEDRHTLRSLAARLVQWHEPKLGAAVYKRIAQLAPEEPQSFRDLGLALAAAGERQQAIDTLYEVVTRQWNPRFPDVEMIALADLNAIVATSTTPLDVSRIDPRLIRNMPLDLRIVLTWDADNTNVDLLVTDPNGQSLHPGGVSYQGGRVSRNVVQGYGPEEYAVRVAKPGRYRVSVGFWSDARQIVAASPVLARVQVHTKFATGEQAVRTHDVLLHRTGQSAAIADIDVPARPDDH